MKVVFGKLLTVPSCVKNVTQCVSIWWREQCVSGKNTICNAKFGDLGDNGYSGSKYEASNLKFGIQLGLGE